MENIVTEEIKWVPMTSDERPAEYEDVLVVIDRWSSITGKWVKNDVLETKWLGEYFDICAPYRWSPEHMPTVKYWAYKPVGPVDPEQKVDYDYRNRRETEYMVVYPLCMNEKATIKDAINFVYGPEDKRSYRGTIHILVNSDPAPVTKYNTIEFVDVHSEDINSYADLINKIFYKYPYDCHDDKVDAVATTMKVYSGTNNPYTKTLEKHFLNSLYGTEGWHWTPDGPKPACDSRVGYDLGIPRWELAKSKFELDYSNHPDYSSRPEFLTKCVNMPYIPLKAEVLGDFEPPAERIDYTKELLKKVADQFDIPYGILEAADIVNSEGENDMRLRVPEIKKVIFNKPAVIILWKDGTKTIVKAQGKSRYDKEKGLAMAIAKKALGNEGNYYNEFRKWLEE